MDSDPEAQGNCDLSETGFETEPSRYYTLDGCASPALRGGRYGASRVSDNEADSHCRQSAAALRTRLVHVRAYAPPSWLTKAGVNRKRRAIERKGLPGFANWRFITLTLDRVKHNDNPLEGYLAGKDRMRRFLKECRDNGLWAGDAKWAWKMEFHSDGWCHWHLLVERTRQFSKLEMRELERLWAIGRTNCKRVRINEFLYSFKYAFKAAFQAEASDEGETSRQIAPSWFLDYYAEREVPVSWTDTEGVERKGRARKGVTFSRVRFWQTSKGFYTGTPPARSTGSGEQVTWTIPQPVRVAADRLECSVQVIARNCSGAYRASATLTLSCSSSRFWDLVGWATIHGAAVGLGVNSFCIPADLITNNLHNPCHLHPILQQNRLTPRAAEKLQLRRESLRTF